MAAWTLMLLMSLQSWAIDFIYANVDKMNIYEEKDTKSSVLKTVPGGAKLLVEVDEGAWYGVLTEAKGGDGQTLGWVREQDSALAMPSQYCKHNWSEWETYSQPTCTEEGLKMRGCDICGVGEAKPIEKLGHDYGSWTVTRQASCTQEGERVQTCRRCQKQKTETIEKEPHRFNEWTVTIEPTCTREGERVHTCIICGTQERQVLDRLPHTYGEWDVVLEPTCTKEGERTHTCLICGYLEYEIMPMLPHDYEWIITTEETDHSAGVREQVCKVCGQKGEEETFDPEGTLRRGDRGEEVQKVQQLLMDQEYLTEYGADGKFGGATEKALMDFQEDQGLTPDGIAWPQTIKRLQHTFGAWRMQEPLTRDTPGEKVRTCKECGFEQHETIPLEPYFERGNRGEAVRSVQYMLTDAGFEAGNADGIYGAKFDAAFEALAAEDDDLEFEAGKVLPVHIDALVNRYIESLHDEKNEIDAGQESGVNLSLTVTPGMADEAITEGQAMAGLIEDEEEEEEALANRDPEGLVTYSWSLTNEGEEDAVFRVLLLQFGDDADFRSDNYAIALNGETLLANGANTLSGSFKVSEDWGKGSVNFTALAVSGAEEAEDIFFSNTETFEAFAPEEKPETAAEEETEEITEAVTEEEINGIAAG